MSEENKALVRRYVEEVWNKGNLTYIDDNFAPDCLIHDPEGALGREEFKQFVSTMRTAFPDFHHTIEDMVAEGDKVVDRFTVRATHKGEFMGVPATGKQVTVTGIVITRLAGGKTVEEWANYDRLGMMQQLGVVPPPAQAGG